MRSMKELDMAMDEFMQIFSGTANLHKYYVSAKFSGEFIAKNAQ